MSPPGPKTPRVAVERARPRWQSAAHRASEPGRVELRPLPSAGTAGPQPAPERARAPRRVQDPGEAPRLATDVPVVVIATTPYAGLAIARSLGRLGVSVHGVHPVPRSAAARSRYWRSSEVWDLGCAPEQESLQWLLQLGQAVGQRPLLVCTDDRSSLFVADHAPALGVAFRFPAQPAGLAHALSSKRQLYHLCTQHGIPTAHTLFPRSREDVLRYAETGPFPVMLKGVDTQALWRRVGVRMRRVEDARTLLSLYEQWETPHAPNLMLQELIPGSCENIWMLSAYFDAGGRCLFAMSGRKLREYPAYRGVTCLGVCEHNPAVLALCERFMTAVGYRGILDLDFKLDERTGEYKALDANPRIGANFRLFVDAQGNDVIRACYRDLTGQPVPALQPNDGRKWLVEDFDCAASLRYLRDGALGAGTWLRSFSGVEEAAWFAPDDPRPALSRSGHVLLRVLRTALGRPAPLVGDPALAR